MIDVEEHLKLVHLVIKREFHTSLANPIYADYYSVGCIGLVYAGKHFKPEYGFAFSTYAVPQISGHIKRFRRDHGFDMRHSRKQIDLIMRYYGLSNKGYADEEIAKQLEITEQELSDLLIEFESMVYLDNSGIGEENDSAIYNVISDPKANFEEEVCSNLDLQEMMDILKDVHPTIYAITYLMLNGEPSQQVIASVLDLSQPQISRCLIKLKKELLPALNKYMDGEITYAHLKYLFKPKYGKGKEIMQPELYVLLKTYMTDNINKPLNITKFVNQSKYTYNSTVPYYVRLLFKEFEKEGYTIEKLGKANIIRPRGYVLPEVKPLEECKNDPPEEIIKDDLELKGEITSDNTPPKFSPQPPKTIEKNILYLEDIEIPDGSTIASLIESFKGCIPEGKKGRLTLQLKIS